MQLRDYVLSLSAGIEQQIRIKGDYFCVYESSGPVLVSIDSGPWVDRDEGDEHSFDRSFSDIRIISATAQVVTLVAGYGRLRSNIKTISTTIAATFDSPSTITIGSNISIPPLSSASLVVACGCMVSAAFKAQVSNTGNVHLGPYSIGAGQGFSLGPGEKIYMDFSALMYGYNPHATDSQTIEVFSLS